MSACTRLRDGQVHNFALVEREHRETLSSALSWKSSWASHHTIVEERCLGLLCRPSFEG